MNRGSGGYPLSEGHRAVRGSVRPARAAASAPCAVRARCSRTALTAPLFGCRRGRESPFRRAQAMTVELPISPLDEPPGSGAIVPAMRFSLGPAFLPVALQIALSITKGMAEVFRDALWKIIFL